jgi:flavin reductase (DIM6/NTAB) family NADH-FMN oxidoreductase RutF
MELIDIPFDRFNCNPVHLFDSQWFLLISGDYESKTWNSMTISWGSIGVVWNRPFVQVFVRPTRHTFDFLEQFPDFTLCAFPGEYRKVMQELGSKTGRRMDKINYAKLTPVQAQGVKSPAYAEAELIISCRKLYWQDMEPSHFIDPSVEINYNGRNYHRTFFGEIVAIQGISRYTTSTN